METLKELIIYKIVAGRAPFTEYIESLKDRMGALRIMARIRQAQLGNLGNHRTVHQGVVELKINYGPGYRVYLGLYGAEVIVLLCAGDKTTQGKDIALAHAYWSEWRNS